MASRSPCSSPRTTVQAPQSPSAQPSFVPVLPRSSRRKLRTIFVGAIWRTAVISPFNTKERLSLAAGGICGLDGMGDGSLRSKTAFAPQVTQADGVLSRMVRWLYAFNTQRRGANKYCNVGVLPCLSRLNRIELITIFCLSHTSFHQLLSPPVPTHGTGAAKQSWPCTPAMAAGLTEHVWTLREVMRC